MSHSPNLTINLPVMKLRATASASCSTEKVETSCSASRGTCWPTTSGGDASSPPCGSAVAYPRRGQSAAATRGLSEGRVKGALPHSAHASSAAYAARSLRPVVASAGAARPIWSTTTRGAGNGCRGPRWWAYLAYLLTGWREALRPRWAPAACGVHEASRAPSVPGRPRPDRARCSVSARAPLRSTATRPLLREAIRVSSPTTSGCGVTSPPSADPSTSSPGKGLAGGDAPAGRGRARDRGIRVDFGGAQGLPRGARSRPRR